MKTDPKPLRLLLIEDSPDDEALLTRAAIEYLIEERGKSFDPDVVDTFIEMVGRG